MEAIDAELPRADGVAYFNRLYLAVTRAVLAATTGTTFVAPGFIDRLDFVFAGLYFDAEATLDTGATPPDAWRPLIECRADRREPIQFALAGMNAHINHDLAIAVVQTCSELGLAPDDGSPAHRDYETVNDVLRVVEGQVADWFNTGLIADIEAVTPKSVDEALAMWSIVAARELAWEHAQMLWRLRGTPLVERAYLDVLAHTTELAGRAMLV
jgi:hypothetical protein